MSYCLSFICCKSFNLFLVNNSAPFNSVPLQLTYRPLWISSNPEFGNASRAWAQVYLQVRRSSLLLHSISHFFSFALLLSFVFRSHGSWSSGLKAWPWCQDALGRGLHLLPVRVKLWVLALSPVKQCNDSSSPVGLFWELVQSCEGLRAKEALSNAGCLWHPR